MLTHIVFHKNDKNILETAISLEQGLEGNVVQINDDYSIGPMMDMYTVEGIEIRKNWWIETLKANDAEGDNNNNIGNDAENLNPLLENMRVNEMEEIWIWMAPNNRDISGYYWILHYLVPFQGRVKVLYLNNLPFFNEKGNIFYPLFLHQIPAKEFLKARKLARDITISEFEVDQDEWKRLLAENKGIRLLEGGKKLVGADYNFYDSDLKKFISANWQRASKIISQFLSKSKHNPGEWFLFWRLKEIIADGNYETQGKEGFMKEFEIKQKVSVVA